VKASEAVNRLAEARSGVFVSGHPATEMKEERMIKIQAGKQQQK
jgi:hypothetical protein